MNLRALVFLSLVLLAFLPPQPLFAQTVTETQDLDEALERIEKSVGAIKVLSERAKAAPESDQETLAFRLDQRSIRLMDDITKLARLIASLPDDEPEREAMTKRMLADISGTDTSIFRHIANLQKRI